MMKYQPINHNFIPKDNRDHKISKESDDNKSQQKEDAAKVQLNQVKEEIPKKKDLVLDKKDATPPQEVFRLEERIMLRDEIDYLREQLSYSENQLTTLQHRLKESDIKIVALEDELKSYEMYKDDVDKVAALNANITKLSAENVTLKTQLKEQRDHVQMLYLVLLILAIL